MLLAAMCADGADEAVRLLRVFDGAAYDLADTCVDLEVFMHRLHYLYNQARMSVSVVSIFLRGLSFLRLKAEAAPNPAPQGAIFEETGYTCHCLKLLESTRGWIIEGVPYSLGGPHTLTDALKERCQKQMQVWVHLCAEIIKAEFPGYDILSSFCVFRIDDDRKKEDSHADEYQARCTERLAQAFGVSYQGLWDQVADLRPVARQMQAMQKCGNFEAWRAAVRKVQKRAASERLHPVDHLTPVLVRWGAFQSCTTSLLERNFSLILDATGKSRGHMSYDNLFSEIKLLVDLHQEEEDRVVDVARACWTLQFGQPRDSTQTVRLDKGVPRKRPAPEA